MSQDTTTIEELAAQVAGLSEAQRRRDAEDEKALKAHIPPVPKASELSQRLTKYQDAARRVRVEAHAEVDAAYEAQLTSAHKERERLEQRLLELAGQQNAERDRLARALEPIAQERDAIRKDLDRLMRPRVTFEEAMRSPERRAALARINDEARSEMLPVRAGG